MALLAQSRHFNCICCFTSSILRSSCQFFCCLYWCWLWRYLAGSLVIRHETDFAQSQPVSKPITFLGFAFIGAVWGGLAGELFGSTLIGALVLLATAALAGAWLTLILKRHTDLLKLAFVAISLIAGICFIYLYGLYHV
jgi:hypothetical protein